MASGISALVSPDSWIDIQVVRVGEERELMVRRFRYDEAATRLADDPTNTTDFALAARTARTAASAVVDTADIIEAASIVDAAAVEALLIETNAAFAIDGSALIALAESGVPGEVIDLMVALSFPDYFVVNGNPEASQAAPSYGAYGYPVRFFGYWTPAFSPWGWGYTHYPSYGYQGYPGYPAGGRPPSTGKRYGGKVVKGGGYARVTTSPSAPSGGFGRFIREGGSSVGSRRSGGGSQGGNKSGGTTSSSGASVGSKASKGSSRKAKRRDG